MVLTFLEHGQKILCSEGDITSMYFHTIPKPYAVSDVMGPGSPP